MVWSMHRLHGIQARFAPCVKLVNVAVGRTAEDLKREGIEDVMDLILRFALKTRVELGRHFTKLQIGLTVDIARLEMILFSRWKYADKTVSFRSTRVKKYNITRKLVIFFNVMMKETD